MYAAFFSVSFGVFIWSDEDQGLVDFVADISDMSVLKEVQGDLTPKFFTSVSVLTAKGMTMELVVIPPQCEL